MSCHYELYNNRTIWCYQTLYETEEDRIYNETIPKAYNDNIEVGTIGIDKLYTRLTFVCYLRDYLILYFDRRPGQKTYQNYQFYRLKSKCSFVLHVFTTGLSQGGWGANCFWQIC